MNIQKFDLMLEDLSSFHDKNNSLDRMVIGINIHDREVHVTIENLEKLSLEYNIEIEIKKVADADYEYEHWIDYNGYKVFAIN